MILDSKEQKELLLNLVQVGSRNMPVSIDLHHRTAQLWLDLQNAEIRAQIKEVPNEAG